MIAPQCAAALAALALRCAQLVVLKLAALLRVLFFRCTASTQLTLRCHRAAERQIWVRITGPQFCNAFSGPRIDTGPTWRLGRRPLVVGVGWRRALARARQHCPGEAWPRDGDDAAQRRRRALRRRGDQRRRHGRGERPTRSGCAAGTATAREAEAPRRVSGLCMRPRRRPGLLACCAGELYAFPLPALDKPPRRLLAHVERLTEVIRRWTRGDRRPQREGADIPVPPLREIESTCLGHTDVSGVEFLSGTRLVSCGGDGIRVWDRRPATASPEAGVVCTCLAVSAAAVAVAYNTLDVRLSVREGVLAEDPLFCNSMRHRRAAVRPTCFRGSSLVALCPGTTAPPQWPSRRRRRWTSARRTRGRAGGAGCRRGPGRRRPVGPLPALERDHAHATPPGRRRRGQAVILRKHALEARYDVSQLGGAPNSRGHGRGAGRARAGPESPARHQRGGGAAAGPRRDEPESKD